MRLLLFAVGLLGSLCGATAGAQPWEEPLPSTETAQAAVEALPIAEVLGPLAPLALSPYFGLLCLSGMSLANEQGWLPENLLLEDHPLLQDWRFFAVLLFLTLMTSAPKLFTVSKFFAQAADQVEAYSALVLYLLVIVMANLDPVPVSQEVLHAGLFDWGWNTLLMLACVLNFVLVNTVKYFFELLAMITPIPMLDAFFEISNKTVCLVLALIYAWNPYLALVPGAIIFFLSLMLFSWARRGMRYYKTLLLDPLWKGTVSRLMGRALPEVPVGMATRVSHALGERMTFVAKAFPQERLAEFRARDLCYLAITASGVYLIQVPWLSAPRILPLRDYRLQLIPGILARRVVLYQQQKELATLVISRYADVAAARGALGDAPADVSGGQSAIRKANIRAELG